MKRNIFLITYNDCYGNGEESIEGYVVANDYEGAEKKLIDWCTARNKARVADGNCEEWEDEFDIEQIHKLDPKNPY